MAGRLRGWGRVMPCGGLDAVAHVGLRLVRSARSGRVLLAQLALGVDDQWVSRPRGEELLVEIRRAQAATAEPLPIKRVGQSLKAAWGVKPTDELDELECEPVAVTPTSQIHRASLDGAPFAVKVQRPARRRGRARPRVGRRTPARGSRPTINRPVTAPRRRSFGSSSGAPRPGS